MSNRARSNTSAHKCCQTSVSPVVDDEARGSSQRRLGEDLLAEVSVEALTLIQRQAVGPWGGEGGGGQVVWLPYVLCRRRAALSQGFTLVAVSLNFEGEKKVRKRMHREEEGKFFGKERSTSRSWSYSCPNPPTSPSHMLYTRKILFS